MEWFLVVVHMAVNGDVTGTQRKTMKSEIECRRQVDRHEPMVINGSLWVKCERSLTTQTAQITQEK
jgi:hypothetical protein